MYLIIPESAVSILSEALIRLQFLLAQWFAVNLAMKCLWPEIFASSAILYNALSPLLTLRVFSFTPTY